MQFCVCFTEIRMRMLNRLLTIVLFLLGSLALYAGEVSEQEALQKAMQFMPNKQFVTVRRAPGVADGEAKTPYYIFNASDGGFVLVSGDDRTATILGYSKTGKLDEADMPANLRYWLACYAEQINSLDHGTTAVSRRALTAAAVNPLIQTKWNQGSPYNNLCPIDPETNAKSVTGCVATAMAQVLYYHKWPEHIPAIEAYTPEHYGKELPALPATDINWDAFALRYSYGQTGTAADAVAQLMRYCGQSVKMNYASDGSGAWLNPKALKEIFDYSDDLKAIYRKNFASDTWDETIYKELAEGRPVLYSGQSSDGGHQFIIDGYDGNGLFHINWGWGGSSDNYFVLSAANPYEESGKGYSGSQDAIIGVQPKQVPSDYTVNSITVSEDVIVGEETDITVSLTNNGSTGRERIFLWIKQNGNWVLLASVNGTVKAGATGDVVFTFMPTTEGTFDIKVTSDAEGNNVKTTGSIQVAAYVEITTDEFVYDCNPVTRHAMLKKKNDYYDGAIVSIPATFESGGTTYTVIGIEKDAFWGAYYLQRLELPATLRKIGKDAFAACKNLSLVVSHIVHPFVIDGNTFSQANWNEVTYTYNYFPSSAALYVPIGSKMEYEAIEGWTQFARIAEGEPKDIVVNNIMYLCLPDLKTATVVQDNSYKELTTVSIPAQVEHEGVTYHVVAISNSAFDDCYKITSLTLPSTLKTIGDYAFSYCSGMKDLVIPEGCETIGNYAFAYCTGLQKLTLPSTLTSIGNNAFRSNRTLNAVVSHIQTPMNIDVNVFRIANWNSEKQEYEYTPSPAILYVPVGTKSAYQAIEGWTVFAKIVEGEPIEVTIEGLKYRCLASEKTATLLQDDSYKELTMVNIPAQVEYEGVTYSVVAIEDRAFYRCQNIDFQLLPSTLKTIGRYAFWNCNGIKELVIPEGCESIGEYAFRYCNGLRKLTLPSTLTSIGDYAFSNNTSLVSVISRIKSPMAIDVSVFRRETWNSEKQEDEYSPSPAILYVPVGTKSAYQAIEGWTMFSGIVEGEPIEVMIDGLKYQCLYDGKTATVLQDDSYKELTTVNIPAQVEHEGVTYSVVAIIKRAFYNCYNIKSLTLPSTLKTIGDYAFIYSGMKEVVIPEGCETVGNYAFAYCSNLKKLTLPSTLTAIGNNAFQSNIALNAVVSHIQTPMNIDVNVFQIANWNYDKQEYEYTPSPATLYVPVGTKAAYQAIEGWTVFAKIAEGELIEVTIDGLRYRCLTGEKTATVLQDDSYKELTTVSIPAQVVHEGVAYSVVAIEDYAFEACTRTAFQPLPATLKTIGRSAFWNCNGIRELVIPEGCETIGGSAFSYCYGLRKLTLPSTLTSIGDYAFCSNTNMVSVTSRIKSPMTVNVNVFSKANWNNDKQEYEYSSSPATLYVPRGTKSAYQALEGWSVFAAIEEYDLPDVAGDLDGDGKVGAADVVTLTRYILLAPTDAAVFKAADLNGDGKIDIADLVKMINNTAAH